MSFLESQVPTKIKIFVSILVILGTLGISVLTSMVNPIFSIVIAILPFAIISLFVLLRRFYLAPILLLFVAAYVPLSMGTGTGSRLVASLILAVLIVGIWFLKMLIDDKRISIMHSPVNFPIIAFIVITLFSLGWSNIFRDPSVYVPGSFVLVQGASALIMIISPLILLLVANVVRDQKYLKIMTGLMLSLGPIGLVKIAFWDSLPVNTSGLAGMWIVGLAISLVVFAKELSILWKTILSVVSIIWVFYSFIINLSWIAGWLPIFIASGVVFFLRSKRLFAGLLVLVAVFAIFNFDKLKGDILEEQVVSGDTRLDAWATNWEYTSQHWLFGMGPAGYVVYYMTYNPFDAMATHSNYIDIVAETGVFGFLSYVGIFGILAYRGIVVYRRLRGRGDFLQALAAAGLGGLAGCIIIMGFGDWLIPFAYTQTIAGFNYSVYNWIFLGTILSLDFMTLPEKKELSN